MKKIIRLSESDLTKIVKRVVEQHDKLAFIEEIKYDLIRYLNRLDIKDVQSRADQVMDIHKHFIRIAQDKLSSNDIAKSLYEYEKNIRKH
jgi:hypothetical protein